MNKFKYIKTEYYRKKRLHKNPCYVAPMEWKAVGMKWKSNMPPHIRIPDHHLTQTTFQIVPIRDTLHSLFLNPNVKQKFDEYNTSKHQCIEGVYKDYCCAGLSQRNDFLRRNDTIVIQIGSDQFEVCCGLKTKAIIHKVFAVYFQIKNMPIKYSPRLNNIHLAALCKSDHFKESGRSENDVIDDFVRDLEVLESRGIEIDGTNYKIALFNVTCDNLGANILFGFARSFSATYYCRFCEHTKEETGTLTNEVYEKRRTIIDFDEQLRKLEIDPKLDLKETKGVREFYSFNKLANFHVPTNLMVDIMHDFCEGIIPAFMTEFFGYCLQSGAMNKTDICHRIRDFNYGSMCSKNKPSELKLNLKKLGQNAVQ